MSDNDKRPIFHIDLEPLTGVILILSMALLFGGFFLVRGIQAGDNTAFLVLGAIVTLGLSGLGGIWVLVIQGVGHRREDRRARQEQERFAINTQENLALMGAVQKVQSSQNTMLLKQAREAQRMLPDGGGDVIDVDALLIEEEVFADLED